MPFPSFASSAAAQQWWHSIAPRLKPEFLCKNDVLLGVSQTVSGALLGVGISGFMQTVESRGAVAALTGTRLGWSELNWTSLGSALLTGAAVGASVGIATYLAKEGYKAKKLSDERSSTYSQSNMSLKIMTTSGPSPWAIHRILEKDPKAMPWVESAILAYVQSTTHATPQDAQRHATIALAAGMLHHNGIFAHFEPTVMVAKKAWLTESLRTTEGPATNALLGVLSDLPMLKSMTESLPMHAAWVTLIRQSETQDTSAFKQSFHEWCNTYFMPSHDLADIYTRALETKQSICANPGLLEKTKEEERVLYALLAGALLDTQVALPQHPPVELVFDSPSIPI